VAAKSFAVKLSKLAQDIDSASKKLKKIRKNLSKKDQSRLDLNMKRLAQAKALLSLNCGKSGRMTAKFFGPTS
jgi:hypothetical protein